MRRQPHAGGTPPPQGRVCHGSQCRGKKGVRLPRAPEQRQERGRRGVAAVGASSTPGEAPPGLTVSVCNGIWQRLSLSAAAGTDPGPGVGRSPLAAAPASTRCSSMGRGWCCHRARLAQSPFAWLLFSCCQRPISPQEGAGCGCPAARSDEQLKLVQVTVKRNLMLVAGERSPGGAGVSLQRWRGWTRLLPPPTPPSSSKMENKQHSEGKEKRNRNQTTKNQTKPKPKVDFAATSCQHSHLCPAMEKPPLVPRSWADAASTRLPFHHSTAQTERLRRAPQCRRAHHSGVQTGWEVVVSLPHPCGRKATVPPRGQEWLRIPTGGQSRQNNLLVSPAQGSTSRLCPSSPAQ